MSKLDIVIFGARDWTNNWITQHRLANSFAESGNRVLFIENTGIRSPKIRDLPRILQRIKNWRNSIGGFKKINENLSIFSPLILPFPYNKTINKINNFLLKKSLSRWLDKNKFNYVNYITFLATPLINNYIDNSNYFVKIYYCGDDHEEVSNNSKFPEYEKEMVSSCDLNFATSQKLYEKLKKINNDSHKVSAGVELDKFNVLKKFDVPNDLKDIKSPILAYIGGLNEKIDTSLLFQLAENRKYYSIVIIGNEDGNFENKNNLSKVKNIYFLGKKKHEEIPKYIANIDCGIIPYKVNKFTDSVYPSKLNEFLSMGKSVVTTNFYEMTFFNQDNQDSILVANNNNEFLQLVDKSLSEKKDQDKINQKISVAKKNQWSEKFEYIRNLIVELNSTKKIANFDWQKNFEAEYVKLKKKIYSFSFILLIIYGLIFVSPLPYFFGKYLIVNDKPKKTDLIVALSGYGDPDYINNSYQQRSLDVYYYYKRGFGDKILLSGRKQLIEEFDLMRSILIGLGIPDNKIFIIEKDFASTYTNLLLVNSFMKKNSIKEANLITSPYHQRRTQDIFKKISKENKINLLAQTSNETDKKWFFGISQIKVILYEYLSLIYNKVRIKN